MALDIIVLIILGLSVIVAFFRGFIREVLTIAGLVGAAIAAITFGDNLTPVVTGWLSDPNTQETGKIFDLIPVGIAAMVIAYAMIFIGMMIVISIATHYISKGAQSIGLGMLDRSLGILFGLVRGIVLVGLLYLPFHHLLADVEKERWFGHAKTYPYVEYTARVMQAFIPSPQPDLEEEVDTSQDETAEDMIETEPTNEPVPVEEEPPFNE